MNGKDDRDFEDIFKNYEANEHLLQAYRSTFISSQSILLTLGGVSLTLSNLTLTLLISGMGLIMIWYMWFRVVVARHRIVDYYKYQYLRKKKTDIDLHDYVHNKKDREKFNKEFAVGSNWRPTRRYVAV